MKCAQTYPAPCQEDAVCIYGEQPLCGRHARHLFEIFLDDARSDYEHELKKLYQDHHKEIETIQRDFRAAMDAGIQPQDLEETPDDQDDW